MEPVSDAHIAFGREVRRRREARKWSQEELSRRAHMHLSYIGQTERGQRNISLTSILRLAEALDTPPEKLVAATGSAGK